MIERVEIEGQAFEIERPADDEPLVRAAEARGDMDPSYWARLWPTSRAMAAWVGRSMLIGEGTRVLEIGCGLGLVGIAAARRGAKVLLTDLDERGVELARRNAARNGVDARVARFDWREPAPAQWAFDVMIGSDVLYRETAQAEIAALAATMVARAGCVTILGEPNRRSADGVATVFERAGLAVWSTPLPGGRVFLLRVA